MNIEKKLAEAWYADHCNLVVLTRWMADHGDYTPEDIACAVEKPWKYADEYRTALREVPRG